MSEHIHELGADAEDRLWDHTIETDRPIPVRLYHGRVKGDGIGMSGPMCLVSGRVKELLIGADCKGASFHPVVVYDRKDAKIVDRDTWWLRPQRGCGRIDTSRGSFLINSSLWRTDPELKDAVGLYFDPKTWTGLDVFLSATGNTVFVTDRIAEVLRNAGVTMIELDPAPLYGKRLRDDLVADWRKRLPERFKPRSG